MLIVLDWRAWLEDIHVRRFEEDTHRDRIEDWVDGLPSNRTAFIFDTRHPLQQEVESAWIPCGYTTTGKLLEIYNALVPASERIKSFHDRDTAFRRIALKLVQRAEGNAIMIIPQPQKENTMENLSNGEEAEVKVKKTRTPKVVKEKVAKAPGIISTLVTKLKDGGGTVEELYQHLAEAFPDKVREDSKGGMRTTIRVQIVRLAKTGKLNIVKEKVEGRGLVYSGFDVD